MDNSTKVKIEHKLAAPQGPFGRGGPGAQMFGAGGKAKDFKGTIKKLTSYLKPFKIQISVVIFLAIASTAFTIISPKMLGSITNQIVDDYVDMKVYDQLKEKLPAERTFPPGAKGADFLAKLPDDVVSKIPATQIDKIKALDLSQRPSINFDKIGEIILILLGLYLLSALFSYIQGWLMAKVSQRITFTLRENISKKMSKLPLKYYDSKSHGDILSRITNDVDTIGQSLNQSLTQMITSFTTIIGIAIMMITISWELTLVAIMVIPLSFGFIGLIVKKSQKFFKNQAASLGEINGHVEEMYSGHNVVKVFNGEKA